MPLLSTMPVGQMQAFLYDTELSMGEAAAKEAAGQIKAVLAEKGEVNIIFAAARSQIAFLNALTAMPSIDWAAMNAFHMDEYAGVASGDRRSLAWFLQSRYFNRLGLKNIFFIDGMAADGQTECARYGQLLRKYPADITFLGIGDNGHLAFNDPHVACFTDRPDVKQVYIDDISKQQQVNAGNFETISDVPSLAYTVTIPALMRSASVICIVPTADKAHAVAEAIHGEITERCPASILRLHPKALLFLDADSASGLAPAQ